MLKKISGLVLALSLLAPLAGAVQINGQLEKAHLERLASDPATTTTGRIYYNTTSNTPKVYNGSAWKILPLSSTAGTADLATALAANPTDCGAGTKATAIDANGNLTCSSVDLSADTAATALPATKGGTGQTSFTTGDILYASSSSALSKLNVGSSGQFLKVAGGVPSWGPGASGINYFSSNPDAESDTTGWTTYADAAGTAPVDMTGGSPTVTWTRSTSSPLRGSGSFLLTKDAANRQGEGVAFAVTLDSADQARVLNYCADYTVVSGTYADDDVRLYAYDVTNSTVIQPAGYLVKSVTAGLPSRICATYQTASNSTSYRVGLHVASTSSSAYVLKFDNFSLQPQTTSPYGAVVTDQTENSNWSTNNFGTLVVKKFFQRRSGDTLFVKGFITAGTTAASTASISLPSGMALDSAKLPAFVTRLGTAEQIVSGAGGTLSTSNRFVLFYDGSDTSKIYITYAGGSSVYTKQNGSTLLASGDSMSFEFAIPVAGYSSGVITSDQSSDSRVVSAHYKGQPTGSIAASFNTATIPTKVTDTTSSYSGGTYTVPVSGYYNISAQLAINFSAASNKIGGVAIFVDGTQLQSGWQTASGGFLYPVVSVQGVYLTAGQAVTIRSYCDGTSPTYDAGTQYSYFSIAKVQAPNQVAATETVAARFKLTSSTGNASLANSAEEVVDFDSKDYDTHGAVTTGASWKFTAPIPGKYRVSASFLLQAAAYGSVNSTAMAYLRKNGSKDSVLGRWLSQTTTSVRSFVNGSRTINLLAGDYIDIAGLQNSGGAVSFDTGSSPYEGWIEIERVGN